MHPAAPDTRWTTPPIDNWARLQRPSPGDLPSHGRAFDYTSLEEAMAHLDAVVRNSRNALRTVLQGGHKAEAADPEVAGQD
jgi:hypothetical protein